MCLSRLQLHRVCNQFQLGPRQAFRNEHPELAPATTFDLEDAVCRCGRYLGVGGEFFAITQSKRYNMIIYIISYDQAIYDIIDIFLEIMDLVWYNPQLVYDNII